MNNETNTPTYNQQPTSEFSMEEKPKNPKLKKLIFILLATILIGGFAVAAYLYLPALKNDPEKTQPILEEEISESTTPRPSITSVFSQTTPTPDLIENETETPVDWITYTEDNYTFQYPQTAEVSTEGLGPNTVRVTFMGQKQIDSGRTQTELWDGYAVTISKYENPENKNLEQIVNEAIETSKTSCPTTLVVSEPVQTTIGGQPSLEYTDTCMGEAIINYIESPIGIYVTTRFNASDEVDLPIYKGVTGQIVKSIRLQ